MSSENTSAETPILKLGGAGVKFSTTTAAFAEIQRSSEWCWAEQQRVGNTPALQFTGYGTDTITLPCTIFPGQAGTADTLSDLRKMADTPGNVYQLIDSAGTYHGDWVIKSISETYSAFRKTGEARKIEFNLTLARYKTVAENYKPASPEAIRAATKPTVEKFKAAIADGSRPAFLAPGKTPSGKTAGQIVAEQNKKNPL